MSEWVFTRVPAYQGVLLLISSINVAQRSLISICLDSYRVSCIFLFLLFWHAPLGLQSAIHRHQPPQRAVLSQVDCFVHVYLYHFNFDDIVTVLNSFWLSNNWCLIKGAHGCKCRWLLQLPCRHFSINKAVYFDSCLHFSFTSARHSNGNWSLSKRVERGVIKSHFQW